MLKNYTEYGIVDFLLNDSFLEWATGKSLQHHQLWSAWPYTYPEKAEQYYQALEIARNLKIQPHSELTNLEIAQLVAHISSETIDKDDPVLVPEINWYQQKWLRIAASILIVSGIGLWASVRINTLKTEQPDIVLSKNLLNKTVNPEVIRLPDNSTVILKAGSKLSYAKQFNGKIREVYLDGEAFFEVAKDSKRPFIVHTNELITKVLGTSFSVKAYNKEKEFSVRVNTGKVSVFTRADADTYSIASSSLKKNGRGVLIMPNQEVTFYRNETKLVKKQLKKPTDLSTEVTQFSLNFKDTPFSEVVKALNKTYNIKITYNEAEMANCPLTASLSDQHLYEKLDLICQALEANYKIIDGEIVIKGKGCSNKL